MSSKVQILDFDAVFEGVPHHNLKSALWVPGTVAADRAATGVRVGDLPFSVRIPLPKRAIGTCPRWAVFDGAPGQGSELIGGDL